MEENYDSICIKLAETDEELCGRGYVHCTSWQEAYRGIVCDRYLDSMTVAATTARARQFPENTLIAKDKEKVVGFAVYGPSRDEDLIDAGEVIAIYVLSAYRFVFITNMVLNLMDAKSNGILVHQFQSLE